MTREEAKEFIRRYSNGLWGMVRVEHIDKMINEIYNDLEAQLKAKDEEIERLKAELNQDLLHMPDDVYNRQAKIKDTE